MARIRTIGRYGNAWVIKINPTDVKDLQLREGDEVDIEDIIIKVKGEKKNART